MRRGMPRRMTGAYAILNHLHPAITRRRFLVAGSNFAVGAVIAPAKGRATGLNNRHAGGAALTRAIHLLPKVYRLDSPISLPSHTSVYFNGATLKFTDATPRPAAYLQGEGTAAAAIPLSVDATRGDRAIKLTDASTIGPEDMLRLWSTARFDPGATDSYKGEMVTVSSVTGNVVRLTGEVQDDYTTAEAARVEKITPVENIRLIGPGKIQGDNTAHSTDYAINFYRARKCSVEGLDLREVDLAHIRFRDAVDCHARHCRIEMTRTISTGYGVSFADATQDCSAKDNWFRRCRHSLSTNNSSNYGGVPRRILFENNFVLDSARSSRGAGGDAIDVHSAAENITIRGNHVLGSTGHGINVECSSATIESNHIEDVGHDSSLAYAIHAANRTGRVGTLSVKNNTLKHIQGSRGINILKHPTAGSAMTACRSRVMKSRCPRTARPAFFCPI